MTNFTTKSAASLISSADSSQPAIGVSTSGLSSEQKRKIAQIEADYAAKKISQSEEYQRISLVKASSKKPFSEYAQIESTKQNSLYNSENKILISSNPKYSLNTASTSIKKDLTSMTFKSYYSPIDYLKKSQNISLGVLINKIF